MQARVRNTDLEARSATRSARCSTGWGTHNSQRVRTTADDSPLSVHWLPTKLLEEIVYALGACPVHLTRCMGVSREWREIAGSDNMWWRICASRWPSSQISPTVVTAAGGPRAFFTQRQMTIALLDAHSRATAEELSSRVLASNARVTADYLWMIDLLHADGTVLLSQVIEPDPIEWEKNFPVVTELELTDAVGRSIQFKTVVSMIDELLVSINVIRRSDNKMLCVANNQRLRQQIVDSEDESELEQSSSGNSEAPVAEMLDVISVDCPFDSELTFDHFGNVLPNRSSMAHEEPRQMIARLELDGTDPATKGQVTAALILLSEGDYVSVPEFAETMRMVPWI